MIRCPECNPYDGFRFEHGDCLLCSGSGSVGPGESSPAARLAVVRQILGASDSPHESAIAAAYRVTDRVSGMEREVAFYKGACERTNEDVCQTLGKALGYYPWFKDDQKNFSGATEADGVCVGDHTAGSLADEAADEVERLRKICEDAGIPTTRPSASTQ